MRIRRIFPLILGFLLLGWPLAGMAAGLERLYVLDCGENHAKDQSRCQASPNGHVAARGLASA